MADIRAVIAAGLAWLYDVPQPDASVLSHHGLSIPADILTDQWWFSFIPAGFRGFPVIVAHTVSPQWVGQGDNHRCANGFQAGDLDSLAAIVRDLGRSVGATWNGAPGSDGGSIGLADPAHPTLLAAVARYRAGCPIHKTIFCGWQGATPAEKACTWHHDGEALVVRPQVPAGRP